MYAGQFKVLTYDHQTSIINLILLLFSLLLLDVASHGLAFFIVTEKQQRQNFFQNLLKTKKLKILIL